MASRDHSRFWRICRIYFRRFRICVWLVILALLCGVLYLNQIGLPDFIKRPVLEKLRARGLDLEFTRMRWHFTHGIVAENVRFGRAQEPVSPQFFVREARVQLDYHALARLRLQVNGLVLRQGNLTWQFSDTNQAERKISIDNIQTELRLLPGDLWELNQFQARFAGANLELGGTVTNASLIRDWKFIHQRPPGAPGSVEKHLRQLADTLDKIHFITPPELDLDIRGDARDLQSFTVRLNVHAPDADTPWASFQHAFLSLVMLPGSSNVLSHAELKLEAATAQTPWAGAKNLNLKVNLISTLPETNLVNGSLTLTASNIETKWGSAENAEASAEWIHAITNAIPLSGHGEISVNAAQSRWGNAATLHVTSRLTPATNASSQTDDSWAWWNKIAPFALDWKCDATDLESPKLSAKEFSCAGNWSAPNLTLTQISSSLYGGGLQATAGVNVSTRQFHFQGSSDFDAQKIAPLLTEKSRHWLGQFAWNFPPQLQATGSIQLPPWTNFAHADWHGEVRPSIRLDGHFDVGDASFRGIHFSSAMSHFSYSNLFWRLPDLIARRPEGEVRITHVSNEATRDYYFRVFSSIDPLALKPLLETNQDRIFDIIQFTQPPVIDGEVWGRWYDHERIGARASLAVTNFSVRGQTFGDATTTLEYTNLWLKLFQPKAHRGVEHASADSIDIDIPGRKLYLTNAVGVADPNVVINAIGPVISGHMAPYHFSAPVSATVNGVIPMHHVADADLHFQLDGGPFEWWKFKLPHVSGRIDWVGERLMLKGIQAQFYRGTASGDAEFDFHQDHGTQFHFDFAAQDADLGGLMRDLRDQTNRLEGLLNARIIITDGNSSDLHTLQGHGRVELRDGLIWEIPIFGILSPVLDSIAPGMGLGSSRAREGSASFTITNGIVRSDDLEIRASMMRLQYWGAVDLVGNKLDARAQAELLRDTWIVGRLLSVTLWPVSKIFEYRFTGTLHQPKSEPVFFVPKILMLPLHPIRALKDLAPEVPPPSTNAPPSK